MDRLLAPANREHLSLDKQLQQLLDKFDLTCAMKSSPSRSKRLKLLKKTINDVRSEMSLKRVLPSHHHCSSFTCPSTSSSSAPSLPDLAKEETLKPNGIFSDDEGMYEWRVIFCLLQEALRIVKRVTCPQYPQAHVRGQK